MDLTYKNEKTLFVIAAVIATLFWTLLILGTLGIALIYLLIAFLIYLFAHSGFISYLKGTGVKITPSQYPDLHQKLLDACQKVGQEKPPEAYILRTDVFNALATKFLRRHYIVLFSDVVDALEDDPDAIDFYIGHELGHIQKGHLKWGFFLAPALIFPVLGTAYRRAQEYTCDQYGTACTATESSVTNAIAVIAAGDSRAKTLNANAYLEQVAETRGFWMSFNEFTSDYPWLTKRMARALAFKRGESVSFPTRHWFAALLSIFVPRLGLGAGGAIGFLIVIAIIGILASIAIPAYQEYVDRASSFGMEEFFPESDIDIDAAYEFALSAHPAFEAYVDTYEAWPTSFTELGYDDETVYNDDYTLEMDVYEDGVIGVWLGTDDYGDSMFLVTEAFVDDSGELYWECYAENYYEALPAPCD